MPVYYDPQRRSPSVPWSKTAYPRVLLCRDIWLCLIVHGALVALLKLELLDLPEGQTVPLEVLIPSLALAGYCIASLVDDCRQRHQAVMLACANVGEETRLFVREMLSSLGRVDEVLPLRFIAAKYALAAVYVFFFAATGGNVTQRAWGELRAKGLLDDREVQFLAGSYSGDRVALLHVWATWAATEAASAPAVRSQVSPEVLAHSLGQMSAALRRAAASAQEVAGHVAVPLPYHLFQLQNILILVSMLLLGGSMAPHTASSEPYSAVVTSGAYVLLLAAVFGLRQVAFSLADPLDQRTYGFPVAVAVNNTADAIAQLLLAAAPTAFNPCHDWWDAGRAVLSQGQIERRTPAVVFASNGGLPCHWPAVKSLVAGEQAPAPLMDIGCCHVDVRARAGLRSKGAGHAYQVTKRPRQDGVANLLAKVQPVCENSSRRKHQFGSDCSQESTADTSCELSFRPGNWLGCEANRAYPGHAGSDGFHCEECDSIADAGGAFTPPPRETSIAGSIPPVLVPKVDTGRGRHRASVSPNDMVVLTEQRVSEMPNRCQASE